MKTEKKSRHHYDKGEKVEIIGNLGKEFDNKPRPIYGKVISQNGFYVLVKPRYQRWVGEWYANELKHIEYDPIHIRKLKLESLNGSNEE